MLEKTNYRTQFILNDYSEGCDTKIYLDNEFHVMNYVEHEQPNTMIDLSDRIDSIRKQNKKNDILVEFDGRELTPQQFNYIAQLPEILSNDEELEVGEFDLGIFKITINKIKTYEKDLIKCER